MKKFSHEKGWMIGACTSKNEGSGSGKTAGGRPLTNTAFEPDNDGRPKSFEAVSIIRVPGKTAKALISWLLARRTAKEMAVDHTTGFAAKIFRGVAIG